MDPFLLETLKNPISAPFLLLIYIFFLFVILVLKIGREAYLEYKISFIGKSTKGKFSSLTLLLISLIIFSAGTFLLFYKMSKIPPGGLEFDDGTVVISAYIIKNLGHDQNQQVSYYPYTELKYHGERVTFLPHTGGIAIYLQTFLQYFVPPGHFSVKLESTLLMFLTSIILMLLFYLVTRNVSYALLCAGFFNVLPWTRILARATPQTTTYCFASAVYLLSFIYLIKSKDKIGIFFYILSLIILFLTYSPALLLALLCAVAIPYVLGKSSEGYYKDLSKKLLIYGIIALAFIFFHFKDEQIYKWTLERAQNTNLIYGIQDYNFSGLFHTFTNNAQRYIANFIAYFSPDFLFFTGDRNLRHNTGFEGQLFKSLCVAFYIGLVYLIRKRKEDVNLKLLLLYLVLSAIPASFCLEGDPNSKGLTLHGYRSSCMLAPLTIVICLGLVEIFKKHKVFFFLYLIVIGINVGSYYHDYFYSYPRRLGNSAIDDQGLKIITKRALKIIEHNPSKNLFYSCPPTSIAYHNLNRIGINALINGSGLLSNVYNYEGRGSVEPKKGDLLLVHENWNYGLLNKQFKYVLRVPNPYLPNNAYGCSLLEITE